MYKNYLTTVVFVDKVEEYINSTFKNKIDRDVILFLWNPPDVIWFAWRPSDHLWRTRNEIFAAIPACNWNTFNRRLEELCKGENKVLYWRTPKPEDWTARHRPPRSFHIRPELARKLCKVRGPFPVVEFARRLRLEGTPVPDDSELLDLVLEWREEEARSEE